MNGARLEKLSDEAYKVTRYPSLRHFSMPDDSQQLSFVLVDVDMSLLSGTSSPFSLQMISEGPLTLFDGDVTAFSGDIIIFIRGKISPMLATSTNELKIIRTSR